MSGISLRDYQSVAKLDRDGTGKIRVSRNDDGKLVNKGGLGTRVLSWIRGIAESKGLVQLDPSRAQRQLDALKGFKEALEGTYGKEVAELAFGATSGVHGAPLTGRLINEAITNAELLARSNSLANNSTINKLLPPIRPGEATPEFLELVGTLGDGVALDQLSDKELDEFEDRFTSRAGSLDLLSGRKQEEITEIARTTLQEVRALSVAGKLDQAIAARRELVVTLKNVLQSLAEGRSPTTVVVGLVLATRALKEHGKLEGGDGDVKELVRAVLGEAMRALGPWELVQRALGNALARDSSLRAVLAQIDDQPENQLSPRQLDVLDTIREISETIVEDMGRLYSPRTVSPETDLERLTSTEDLSRSQQTKALRPVVRLLNEITSNPTAPKQFLDAIKSEYAQVNQQTGQLEWTRQGANPTWNSVEVLKTLDQHVRNHALRDRIAIDTAIQNMMKAIVDDETLPTQLKSKLTLAFSAIEEEFKLSSHTTGPETGFNNLRQEDFWRLFVPQRLVGGDFSKWHIEQTEPGSLAGMQRAFREMLQGLPPQPITAQDLERIHQSSTTNCFKGEVLAMTYRDDLFEEQYDEYLMSSVMPTDFRDNKGTDLTLRTQGETTPAGMEELRRLVEEQDQDDPWLTLVVDGGETTLTLLPKTRQECMARAQEILDDYYARLPDLQTDGAKRQLIAETIQALYRAHLFQDGNSRTVVFTAMNRMLLEAGLPPAILPTPKGAAGFSLQEFSNEILRGQIAFQLQTKPQNVAVPALILQQLTNLENEGMTRERAIATLRGLIVGNQGLTEALRTEAVQALDTEALRLEDSFYARLQNLPQFAGLKREDVSRLFGNQQVNSLPQLERAFDTMLSGLDQPLDVGQIEAINDAGPTPGYRGGLEPEDCRARIGEILTTYRNDIAEAGDDDTAKRAAIARAVKALYDGKFFRDGDSQATVFIVMNRMLVEAGLSPVLLADPTIVGRRSVKDIALEIVTAQLNFRYHAKPETTSPSTFVMNEARRRVDEHGGTLERALSDLRELIAGNPVIAEQERFVLFDRITQAIESSPKQDKLVEDGLFTQLGTDKSFVNVGRNDVWRLVITGDEQTDTSPNFVPSREDLVERLGPDTLRGMERAYGVMLEGLGKGLPLGVEQVMAINDAGPTPGLREGGTSVTIDYGNWLPDVAGIGRLLDEDPWFVGGEIRPTSDREYPPYEIRLPPRSREQMEQKLESILMTYHAEIEFAENDDAKRAVIAKAVQSMYRAQLFPDGERQSTVFLVMNRMLLENGLQPGIYRQPIRAFGFPQGTNSLLVRESQSIFRETFPKPIESNDLSIEVVDILSVEEENIQI